MKLKCCGKLQKPSIEFHASIIDMVGLGVLLVLLLGAMAMLVYAVGTALFEDILSGRFQREIQACGEVVACRENHGVPPTLILPVAFLVLVALALPKFLHACSYLINYRVKVGVECMACGSRGVVFEIPKNPDHPQ